MSRLVSPALRSDDTLGFLAALGVMELSTSTLGTEVLMSWKGVGGALVLDVPFETTSELTGYLQNVAEQMAETGRVLPCAHSGPVRKPAPAAERKAKRESGEVVKLDPANLSASDAVEAYRAMRSSEIGERDVDSARWLAALVNQLEPASDRSDLRALTPLYSPSGQMTLYQLYRDHLRAVVDDPRLLVQALDGWEHRTGAGANLDTRALRDAVSSSRGVAGNMAVLGATWLGLMSVPFFPQVSGSSHAISWERQAGGVTLRWPIWTEPLNRPAVEVLLGHPALDRFRRGKRGSAMEEERRSTALRALGVQAVCRSQRLALRNSAGALRPASVEAIV